MARIRGILSIDGGGIRGIIPATILAHIEAATNKPISQLFDLIAGTSTGGILAMGLAKPDRSGQPQFTARQLCEVYTREIPHIFRSPQSWWGNLITPKYRSHALQRALTECFGDCRLSNALTDVLIPCYDIQHRVPHVFKSRPTRAKDADDWRMVDVALATCASPTLFHPVRIAQSPGRRLLSLVDGGVFANNPAISALAELKFLYPDPEDQVFMVSIGTGKSTRPLSDAIVNLWGYVQWSRPMLDLVMESISESVHEQIQHLLPVTHYQQYYRLQVALPEHTKHAIDNASVKNIETLARTADAFCLDSQSGQELSRLCATLLSLSEQPEEPKLSA